MGSDPPLWPLWALALMGTYIPTQIYIIKIKKMSFPKIRVFVPSMPLNRVGKRCKGEDEKAESRCCGGRWSHTRIKKSNVTLHATLMSHRGKEPHDQLGLKRQSLICLLLLQRTQDQFLALASGSP